MRLVKWQNLFKTGAGLCDTGEIMENASADPSRRKVIAWSGATAATGLAAYLGWPAGEETVESHASAPVKQPDERQKPAELAPVPSGPFNRDVFLQHLNSEFIIEPPQVASGRCKLVEVSPAIEMKTNRGTFTSFSLTFESHPGFLQQGGTCRVTHPALETMEFFLAPIGRAKKDKALLEAAFTLRV